MIERPQPPGQGDKHLDSDDSLREEVRSLQHRVLEVKRLLDDLKGEFERLKQEKG